MPPPTLAWGLVPLLLFLPKPLSTQTPKLGGFTHHPPANLPVNKDRAQRPLKVEHPLGVERGGELLDAPLGPQRPLREA